jgi:hypothetical protein
MFDGSSQKRSARDGTCQEGCQVRNIINDHTDRCEELIVGMRRDKNYRCHKMSLVGFHDCDFEPR